MDCPNCNVSLLIAEKQRVEIDYCPRCRGVWLDRGELDKIIERASVIDRDDDDFDGFDRNRHLSHKKKKKSSFLGDLFDF